jgi:ABC-type branched-subunit amino acid transport system ATPase component
MTVRENLLIACEPRSRFAYLGDLVWPQRRPLTPAARIVITQFGLNDVLDSYPESLSSGVRRLVGIARAVATLPSVLLLDEPAAGLDEISTEELSGLIRKLASEWGMGILLIEHDVSMVMRTCDQVVAINFGQEIATGSPSDIRTNPAVVEAYLGG